VPLQLVVLMAEQIRLSVLELMAMMRAICHSSQFGTFL
jgi:hypothetical protein